MNFFQGECSPDDRELTFRYVKNVIFISAVKFVSVYFLIMWLLVINMIKWINFDSGFGKM